MRPIETTATRSRSRGVQGSSFQFQRSTFNCCPAPSGHRGPGFRRRPPCQHYRNKFKTLSDWQIVKTWWFTARLTEEAEMFFKKSEKFYPIYLDNIELSRGSYTSATYNPRESGPYRQAIYLVNDRKVYKVAQEKWK